MKPPATVYVAGPMDGLPYSNFPLFNEVAGKLRAAGFTVQNPAENNVIGMTHRQIIDQDILQILQCDTMFMLPRWHYSRGAQSELAIAKWRNMTIVFADAHPEYLP